MPILVQDYTWKQTEDRIFVTVPLKGVDSCKVDVFVSECYVKLHYPPFLFELYLRHAIDDIKGKCCFTDSEAHLEFYKKENIHWDCLEAELDRCEKTHLKINAINETHLKSAKRRENKNKLRTEQDRFAVSQAIEFDTIRRNRIKKQRDNERSIVMKEFEDWRVAQETKDKNCVNVTVAGSEVIVENIVDGNAEYSNREAVEISLDEKRLWVTNLRNKDTNQDFRDLDNVLEQCKLYETTSVDMLLDETGLSVQNSVNNETLLYANPDNDIYLYETQSASKKEIKQMPDFDVVGECSPFDYVTVAKDSQGGYILENPINKQSNLVIYSEGCGYVYEVQGAAETGYQVGGEIGKGNESIEISGMKFTTDVNSLTLDTIADEGNSINLDVFQKERTDPEPELNSVLVYVDGSSPEVSPIQAPILNDVKGKFLEPIDELDEDQESFANLMEKYTDIQLIERRNNNVLDPGQFNAEYSDFFRTPQPADEIAPERCSIQSEVCADNVDADYSAIFKLPPTPVEMDKCSVNSKADANCTDDFMPENYGNLSTPCVDQKFGGIVQHGDVSEQDANEETCTNTQSTQSNEEDETYQQLGVEISIDDKGYRTKQFNRFIDNNEQEAEFFFSDRKTFGTSSNCTMGEIYVEKEFTDQFNFSKTCEMGEPYKEEEFTELNKQTVDTSSNYTMGDTSIERDISDFSKETVDSMGSFKMEIENTNNTIQNSNNINSNIETMLKEQQNLLLEHMLTTDKKFEELKNKLDLCCGTIQEKKIKQAAGSGDTSARIVNERKALVKKERTTREKVNTTNKSGKSPNKDLGAKKDVGVKKDANKPTSPKRGAKKGLPPPRKTQTMNISFTERIFPTPCRESSAKEEQEWLKNVNDCRKATGFVCEDLRPEEQDPLWCKEKGDNFYKCGNHLGAISAYSHGIKLCDRMPALYSNRAACHLAVGNYNKCIEDCSSALDLLKPACPSNCDSRAKCIARRAVALTRVGMLGRGIDEMKAAVQLQPHNCQLKDDLYCMERAWEQNPDSD